MTCIFSNFILQAAKKKSNEILKQWVAPIRIHFWHCAKECKGDVDKMKVMTAELFKEGLESILLIGLVHNKGDVPNLKVV